MQDADAPSSHASPTRPTAIKLDLAENVLSITWADGHASRYSGAYLRHVCPCAGCCGHVPGEKDPPPWAQVKDVRVTNVEPVGTYALRMTLSDAHSTGIYSYDLLRRQCPTTRSDVNEIGHPIG